MKCYNVQTMLVFTFIYCQAQSGTNNFGDESFEEDVFNFKLNPQLQTY